MAVTIYEAKSNLSKLIAEVERTGREIVIRRNNVPVAKLVPYPRDLSPRRLGAWAGQVRIADDFDELPDEIAAAFRGEHP
jgi:prevent-host-death family protein